MIVTKEEIKAGRFFNCNNITKLFEKIKYITDEIDGDVISDGKLLDMICDTLTTETKDDRGGMIVKRSCINNDEDEPKDIYYRVSVVFRNEIQDEYFYDIEDHARFRFVELGKKWFTAHKLDFYRKEFLNNNQDIRMFDLITDFMNSEYYLDFDSDCKVHYEVVTMERLKNKKRVRR